MDPENRLVAGELEKGWESALRAQLADLGKRLPELWYSGRLSAEHKKELLRSLIRRAVLWRPKPDSTEIRIVWISGAISTLSVSQPLRRARDLSDYEEMVERSLALVAEGHTDAKIARTVEGFRAARSEVGIPKNFVRDVRRERGIGSPFETLKGSEKLGAGGRYLDWRRNSGWTRTGSKGSYTMARSPPSGIRRPAAISSPTTPS